MLNYKVRARTQTSVEKLLANVLNLKEEEARECGWTPSRRAPCGAWCAQRSTRIIGRACHLDGEGFQTLLGAAGGPFAAAGSFFGEAVVSFVERYLGTADPEVV